jgi:hypothetical protein
VESRNHKKRGVYRKAIQGNLKFTKMKKIILALILINLFNLIYSQSSLDIIKSMIASKWEKTVRANGCRNYTITEITIKNTNDLSDGTIEVTGTLRGKYTFNYLVSGGYMTIAKYEDGDRENNPGQFKAILKKIFDDFEVIELYYRLSPEYSWKDVENYSCPN